MQYGKIIHIMEYKMTKLKIKGTKEEFDSIKKELKTKYGDIVKLKSDKEDIIISFKNSSIFDTTEFDIYKYIKSKYEILNIIKISRSFEDIHNVENSDEFKGNIKDIQEAIKPFYLIKNDRWWIGLDNFSPDNDFEIEKTIREIYKIGLSCGLVPRGMI